MLLLLKFTITKYRSIDATVAQLAYVVTANRIEKEITIKIEKKVKKKK